MINSGDKNVNVVEIINALKGTKYPSGQGIPDGYTTDVPYVEYPRDAREHNPLNVIDGDETKPLDGTDFAQLILILAREIESLKNQLASANEAIADLTEDVEALQEDVEALQPETDNE